MLSLWSVTQGVGSLLVPFLTAQDVSFFAGNKGVTIQADMRPFHQGASGVRQSSWLVCLQVRSAALAFQQMCYWSFLVQVEPLSANAM